MNSTKLKQKCCMGVRAAVYIGIEKLSPVTKGATCFINMIPKGKKKTENCYVNSLIELALVST